MTLACRCSSSDVLRGHAETCPIRYRREHEIVTEVFENGEWVPAPTEWEPGRTYQVRQRFRVDGSWSDAWQFATATGAQ